MQSKQAYEVVRISKQYHPFISGPGGETARRLVGERDNVRINIPPLSVLKDEISVAGEKEGVLAVIQEISKMQKDMVSAKDTCRHEISFSVMIQTILSFF